MLSKSLRFHWSMSSVGETLKASKKRVDYSGVPDIKAHIQFCKKAEACGIEHVLTAFGFHR
ncbi:MAG: alkanesulfonate monooxygenase, partial [Saprospiraceae bacterium]